MRRVLAIDGGGIRGVFPAAFLASIEVDLEYPIGKYFDLIVGTSTGGIIALGLGLGMRAADIVQFYEDHGPAIFHASLATRALRYFGFAKYTAQPLRHAIETIFGDRVLGESHNRLVIPSCSLTTGKVHLWKTAHYKRATEDYKCRVVDVALSTAAAPSYFPTHQTDRGIPLIDGGVWANNPVGVAVVEAVGVLRWDPKSIHVLSLGCANAPLGVRLAQRFALGRLYWATKVTDLFMAAQSSGALGTATHLIDDRDNLVREAPVLDKTYTRLDSVRDVPALKGLGVERARHRKPDLTRFFETPAEPFTPLYPKRDGPSPDSANTFANTSGISATKENAARSS